MWWLATSEQSFLDVDTTLNDNTEPQIFLEECIPGFTYLLSFASLFYTKAKNLSFAFHLHAFVLQPALCYTKLPILGEGTENRFSSFWHLGLAERESHTKGKTEPQNFVKTLKTH